MRWDVGFAFVVLEPVHFIYLQAVFGIRCMILFPSQPAKVWYHNGRTICAPPDRDLRIHVNN